MELRFCAIAQDGGKKGIAASGEKARIETNDRTGKKQTKKQKRKAAKQAKRRGKKKPWLLQTLEFNDRILCRRWIYREKMKNLAKTLNPYYTPKP
jgi:hypothetical protein